jgi:hypothetical protein
VWVAKVRVAVPRARLVVHSCVDLHTRIRISSTVPNFEIRAPSQLHGGFQSSHHELPTSLLYTSRPTGWRTIPMSIIHAQQAGPTMPSPHTISVASSDWMSNVRLGSQRA